MNKKNILIVVSLLTFIIFIGGISYSYFVYNKDVGNISLNTGEISMSLSGINGNQTLSNVIPISDNEGKTSSNYFDFTVNSTVDTERIYYEVYILPDGNNTLDTNYLKTYLTDQNNNELKGVSIFSYLGNSEVENGKVIYKGIIEVNQNGTSRTETKAFRLRMWLDESYVAQASKTFNFDVYLYAKNVDNSFVLPLGSNLFRNKIQEVEDAGGTCSNITYEEDGITYLSGTNECIDMNYVWYSGKLWRITAIYPDNTMKLITENEISSIQWGNNSEYNGSWIYQWLNEDFYDTLNNIDYIIQPSIWNYSLVTNPKNNPINSSPQKTLTAKVGSLTAYEYYISHLCAVDDNCTSSDMASSYLNVGVSFWLITQRDNTVVFNVINSNGSINLNRAPTTLGVRPSIVLKASNEFTGSGTKADPYKIVGDIPNPINNSTLLINRSVGEYLKFDNELYRIVETNKELGITKIIKVDYLRDAGVMVAKKFSNTTVFGSVWNTLDDSYCDYYLNHTWYNNISNTYKNMLVDSTYYLGEMGETISYKNTICKDDNLNNVTVKNCTKYTEIDKTFTGKVGLPRVGEMFAAQVERGIEPNNIWTLTPYSNQYIRLVTPNGQLISYQPSNTYGIRPTLTLKRTIKITGGTGYVGGNTNSPFEISE